MFFLVQRTDRVALAPKSFGARIHDEVESALRRKVEGKCTGTYGYTGSGRLDEDSGYSHFDVGYKSLVFRPFKNEILLAKIGFFASAGPLDIFVSQYGLPVDLIFDSSGASNGAPMLHSIEEDARIEIGTEVRIKLTGIKLTGDSIKVMGTIKEDFLG